MPEPAAQASPPPAPRPAPGLMELMEASLRAALAPGDVFAHYGGRPAPSSGVLAANFLFWAVLGQLLLLVMTFIAVPAAGGLGVVPTLLIVAGGAVLSVPLFFAAAAVVHVLSRLSGGKKDFGRSFQVASMLGAIAPISALAAFLPFEMIGIVLTLYATLLLVRGVSALHAAPGAQAWIVIGLCGAVAAVGQFAFHKSIARFERKLGDRITIYSTHGGSAALREERRRMPGPERTTRPFSGAEAAPGMQTAPRDQRSSLGMIRPVWAPSRPRGPADRFARPPGVRPSPEQMRTMGINAIRMLDRQMKNPAMKKMPEQQRRQIEELLKNASRMVDKMEGKHGAAEEKSEEETRRFLMQMLEQVEEIKKRQGGGPVKRQRRSSAE